MSGSNMVEAMRRIEACRRDGGRSLDLSYLQLLRVPPEIGQLTALTSLDLRNNQLTTLPAVIGQLTALASLDLSGNRLTTLPAVIGQLTALTALNLARSQLTTLPAEIGQLTALTKLNLWDNQLTTLPAEIGQLTALTKLNLAVNELTTLPTTIGRLIELTELSAPGNRLVALPREITRLNKLQVLDVEGNCLTTLPVKHNEFPALTVILLGHNRLRALPEFSTSRLQSMERFDASHNPLLDPPLRVVERGVPEIISFYELRNLKRRDAWIGFASRRSRYFRLRSRFAAIETACMICCTFALAYMAWPQPVWVAALVAPLLLLKTRASVALGTRRFAGLMRLLDLKSSSGRRRAATLPFRLIALGIGSLAIKAVTTARCFVRSPAASLGAMPRNLREQCFEVDFTCAPELVPGLERAYDANPANAFVFSDLTRGYDVLPTWIPTVHWRLPARDRSRTIGTLMCAPILALFFMVAVAYRLYVKGAAPLYAPLLLIDFPDRKRLRLRTAPGQEGGAGKGKLIIQGAVLGLALLGLLGLSAQPDLRAAIGAWLGDSLLRIWDTVDFASWTPRGILALLFLQSLAFLAGRGSESMARSARAGSGAEPPGAVARRWIGIARWCYLAHLVLIVALLVSVFVAIAPNAILIVDRMFELLG